MWLVEDSITAMQLMPDGSVNYNYTHNHVLRAAVNGEWGSTVSIPANNSEESTFSYRLDDNNVADNCYFVAFVYDDSGVKQVAKARVITKNYLLQHYVILVSIWTDHRRHHRGRTIH